VLFVFLHDDPDRRLPRHAKIILVSRMNLQSKYT
jgi:hypothetical protein